MATPTEVCDGPRCDVSTPDQTPLLRVVSDIVANGSPKDMEKKLLDAGIVIISTKDRCAYEALRYSEVQTAPRSVADAADMENDTVFSRRRSPVSRLILHEWPETSTVRCMYCGDTFATRPWFQFIRRRVDGGWWVQRMFCSPGCSSTFTVHENRPGVSAEYQSNLALVYRTLYGLDIRTMVPLSPDKELRVDYGGTMPIPEWVRLSGRNGPPGTVERHMFRISPFEFGVMYECSVSIHGDHDMRDIHKQAGVLMFPGTPLDPIEYVTDGDTFPTNEREVTRRVPSPMRDELLSSDDHESRVAKIAKREAKADLDAKMQEEKEAAAQAAMASMVIPETPPQPVLKLAAKALPSLQTICESDETEPMVSSPKPFFMTSLEKEDWENTILAKLAQKKKKPGTKEFTGAMVSEVFNFLQASAGSSKDARDTFRRHAQLLGVSLKHASGKDRNARQLFKALMYRTSFGKHDPSSDSKVEECADTFDAHTELLRAMHLWASRKKLAPKEPAPFSDWWRDTMANLLQADAVTDGTLNKSTWFMFDIEPQFDPDLLLRS